MKLADILEFLTAPENFDFYVGDRKVFHFLNDACSFDEDSRFFVAGFEFGPQALIHVESYRGDGFEAAYSLWIDSLPTIPEEELIEAYGIDGESFEDLARKKMPPAPNYWEREAWDAWHAKMRTLAQKMLEKADSDARDGVGDYPDLIEGYRFQDNASGTGIVDLGHYEWMNPADLNEITVKRKSEDDAND